MNILNALEFNCFLFNYFLKTANKVFVFVFNFFKKHYILPDSGDSTRNNTEFLFGIKFIIKTGDKELLHKIAVDLLYRLRYSFVRILCDLGMIYSSFVFFFNLIFFLSHFQCRLTKPSLQAF